MLLLYQTKRTITRYGRLHRSDKQAPLFTAKSGACYIKNDVCRLIPAARYPSEKMLEVTKMAVETCVWPLFEVIEGKYILNYKPKNKLPVEEYLKLQGRFAHMFKPGNEWMIEQVQKEVDRNWEELLRLCEI